MLSQPRPASQAVKAAAPRKSQKKVRFRVANLVVHAAPAYALLLGKGVG
jgi:hypothetical protein